MDSLDNLEYKFNKYISKVKKLKKISDKDKLYLYANYKQALTGNNTITKPSILDMVANEKWKAWDNLKDVSKEDSMKNYINKVKELYKNENNS